MTAPFFVASAANGGLLGADPAVNVPTGTVDKDLMIAYGVDAAGTSTAAPAGWLTHPVSLGGQAPLFYRFANGEPASYTFVVSGAGNSVVRIASYRGVNMAAPFDDGDVIAGATGAITLPATTSNGMDRLSVQLVAKLNGGITFTPPASATERWDAVGPTSSYVSAGGDEVVNAGAIGTRIWTPSAGTAGSIGYVLVLNPMNSSTGFLSLI